MEDPKKPIRKASVEKKKCTSRYRISARHTDRWPARSHRLKRFANKCAVSKKNKTYGPASKVEHIMAAILVVQHGRGARDACRTIEGVLESANGRVGKLAQRLRTEFKFTLLPITQRFTSHSLSTSQPPAIRPPPATPAITQPPAISQPPAVSQSLPTSQLPITGQPPTTSRTGQPPTTQSSMSLLFGNQGTTLSLGEHMALDALLDLQLSAAANSHSRSARCTRTPFLMRTLTMVNLPAF